MKKITFILLIFALILIPNSVFAVTADTSVLSIGIALFIEAFITVHMSLFVLLPLSKIISPNNYQKLFITLFIIRILILLFFDFFVTTLIALVDFISVFIGAFLVVPICSFIFGKIRKDGNTYNPFSRKRTITIYEEYNDNQDNYNLSSPNFCSNCGSHVNSDDIYCSICGTKLTKDISINEFNINTNTNNSNNSGPIKEKKKFDSNW